MVPGLCIMCFPSTWNSGCLPLVKSVAGLHFIVVYLNCVLLCIRTLGPQNLFSPLWVNTVQNFPSFSPSFLLPSPKRTRKNVKDANSKQHVPKEDLEFALVKSRLVLQADGSRRVQDHSLFGIIVLPWRTWNYKDEGCANIAGGRQWARVVYSANGSVCFHWFLAQRAWKLCSYLPCHLVLSWHASSNSAGWGSLLENVSILKIIDLQLIES